MLNRTYKFSVKVVNLTVHYLKHDFTNNNKNPTVLGKHKSRKWSQVLGRGNYGASILPNGKPSPG